MRNELKPPFSHVNNGTHIWGNTQQPQHYGAQSSERISRNGASFNSRMEFMPNSGPPHGPPMMAPHPPNMPPPHLTGAPPFIPQNFRQQPQKFGANISILDSNGGPGLNSYPYQNFMSHNAQQMQQQLPMSIRPPEEDSVWRCPTDPQQDALTAYRKWQRDSGTSIWGDPKENNGSLFFLTILFLEKNIRRWQQYFEGENDDVFRTQSPSKQSNVSKEQFGGAKLKESEVNGWGELPHIPELEKLNNSNLHNRKKFFGGIISF